MRIIRKLTAVGTAQDDQDTVIAWLHLPQGATLHRVWIASRMILSTNQNLLLAMWYGMRGYVLPVHDSDTAVTMQILWDTLVPKDQDFASGAFELNTGSANTQPSEELGEASLEQIMGMAASDSREIFRREKLVSFADKPFGYVDTTTDEYRPTDSWSAQIKPRHTADRNSMVLFALIYPEFNDAITTMPSTPASETLWHMMAYMEETLETVFKHLLGLWTVGSGAIPVDEAASLVENLLEEFFSPGGFLASAVSWNHYSTFTFDLSVPGRMKTGVLTSG